MLRMLTTITIIAVAVVSVLAAIVVAAEFEGTVSAMDDKGMATIKATDGKEYKAQIAGVKVGDKVDCHVEGARRPAISSARHTNNTPGEAEQSADDHQARCVAPRRAWHVRVCLPVASPRLCTCHPSPKGRGSTGAVMRASL